MGESDRKPGTLSALYVNTGGMRCDHRGSDTYRILIYFHDEPTNTTTDWQVRQSNNKKKHLYDFCSQICLPPSLFLSALSFGEGWGVGIPFEQASLCIARGRQLDSDKEREREGEKGGREHERCLPCTRRCNPQQTRRALRQWQLTNGPAHGGFLRLPPTCLTIRIPPHRLPLSSLPSSSPLLWNKCQMANKQSSACGCSKWLP